MWRGLFQLLIEMDIGATSTPILFQYLTDIIFKQLIHQMFDAKPSQGAPESKMLLIWKPKLSDMLLGT